MDTYQTSSLVIKGHDFQKAKEKLKKYTEQAAEKEVGLSKVPSKRGIFKSDKVNATELNQITEQIQNYLIELNSFNQNVVKEFVEVYNAFEELDNGYISGIVKSIRTAEKISLDEQKDRKDIKELIKQHQQSIAVLKKFKVDIENLKHLHDIDKIWNLIENQIKLTDEISDYISGLAQLNHLKDIDILWDDSEGCLKKISSIEDSLENQKKTNDAFDDTIKKLQNETNNFVEKVNDTNSKFQANLNEQFKFFHDLQNKNFDSLNKEQSLVLDRIEKNQKDMLTQISDEQSVNWKKALRTIEEEKSVLNDQIANIDKKVKTAYVVASGAVALTVIQLLLSIIGVL